METTVTELRPTPDRLSRGEYIREREAIRETHGDSSREAAAKRDQALAKLFARSGWTQEQLAQIERKSQSWIDQRLRFGRFLEFTTVVVKSDFPLFKLTERSFRNFWDNTDKTETNERIRFQKVVRLINESGLSARKRPFIGDEIIKQFADGKWHRFDTIARHTCPDDAQHVAETLRKMGVGGGTYNVKQERRKVGKHHEYRIFKKDQTVSTDELTEKLTPIIKELQITSERAPGTISNFAVASIAAQIRNLLKKWRE